MAVVVRCTGCRGASQVGPEAVGLLVVCPRCREPFLAIEEASPIAKSTQSPPRRGRAESVRPQREPVRRPRRHRVAEPVGAPGSHDPHDSPIAPAGGLPVSVLIGFALLPFAIPLLWLIGPQLLTQPPALSLAAPAALALSASVLCLSVVFTVDWTPSTRIKGVLMLVGLSYFAGLSLYFLKKDMVDRARDFFGPSERWYEYKEPNGNFSVRVPVKPDDVKPLKRPLAGGQLACFKADHDRGALVGLPVQYLFGSGPDAKPGAEKWFDEVGKAIADEAGPGATIDPPTTIHSFDGFQGRRWIINLPDGTTSRRVEVFRANNRVYYLSVEGEHLDPYDPFAAVPFFNSFHIAKPAGK